MKIVFVLFLVIILLSLVAARKDHVCPIVLPVHAARKTQLATPRVIDGRVPPYRATTYHVALSSPPRPATRRCTATRLSKRWILTAAHCQVAMNWTVSVSAPSIFGGASAVIERVFRHPNYTSATERRFDIALIRIRPPEFEPPNFGTVKLNDQSNLPTDEAFLRVSGFGKSTDEAPTLHNFGSLRFADIPVYPFQKCRAAYKTVPDVGLLSGKRQLCAGYARGGCDACSGDSGGPLVQFDKDGNVVQVAVVSAAKGCALAGFPGINARVDAVLDWMRSTGAQFSTGVPVQVFRNGGIHGAPAAEDDREKPRPSKSPTPTPLPAGAAVPATSRPPRPPPPRRTPPPRIPSGGTVIGPRPPLAPVDADVQPSTTPEAVTGGDDGVDADEDDLLPDFSVEAQGQDEGDGGGLETGKGELQSSGGPRSPSDNSQSTGGVNVLALVLGVVGGAAAVVAALLLFVLRR